MKSIYGTIIGSLLVTSPIIIITLIQIKMFGLERGLITLFSALGFTLFVLVVVTFGVYLITKDQS